MPTFVNTNQHRVYVDNEDGVLHRVLANEEVEATGDYADRLASTPGVFKKGDEPDSYKERAAAVDTFGPAAYPAVPVVNSAGDDDSDGGNVKPIDKMTKDELVEALDSKGVEFKKSDSKKNLAKQLTAVTKDDAVGDGNEKVLTSAAAPGDYSDVGQPTAAADPDDEDDAGKDGGGTLTTDDAA